jgi:hypothetical protein
MTSDFGSLAAKCLPTLPVTQSQAVVTIAVPVVVLGRVYPIHPKGVLWDLNPAIWMANEVPECCCSVDGQVSPFLYVAYVVMLEQPANILHNGNNMVLQNFITVPFSRQCTVDMHQFSPPGVRYRSSHHHTTATKSVGFLYTVRSKTFISPPEHPGSTICTL